jgi:hypothetical protein
MKNKTYYLKNNNKIIKQKNTKKNYIYIYITFLYVIQPTFI